MININWIKMLAKYVGKILNDKLKDEIKGISEVQSIRVLEPEMMGTCDLIQDRVNIHVNSAKCITRITFG